MLPNINKSMLKYLVFSLIIIGIVFFLSKNKLSQSEFLLVILPIIGLYVVFDLVTCSKILNKSEKFENFQNNNKSTKKSSKKSTKKSSKKSSQSTTKKSPRSIVRSINKKSPKSQSKKLKKIAKKLSPRKIAKIAKKLTPRKLGKIAKNLTPNKMAKISKVARKITSIKSPKSSIKSRASKLTPKKLIKTSKKIKSRFSKKQRTDLFRKALFNHVNAKFPNLSIKDKVKKMIELTKDKKLVKQLYIKNVHSPKSKKMSPRKLSKKMSPRKLYKKMSPRKLSKKMSPRKLSKKMSPRKLGKKISKKLSKASSKLSKKMSPRKLSKKMSPRKLGKKISKKLSKASSKLSKKMSPRKLGKKVSKKLSKASSKLSKKLNKSKQGKKQSRGKKVEKFTNLPADLEKLLNDAINKTVDNVETEIANTPVSTPRTSTPVSTPRTSTPVSTPRTTPVTSRTSTPVTTPKVTTPNTMQKAVRTAVSAAVQQAMTKTPNMSAQRIIRNEPSARYSKLLETRADVAGMEREYKRKIRDLERRLSEKDDNSDWKYNQFNIKNMKPLGDGLQGWENDYVLLNTDKWAPSFNPPPVCKTEKSCPVCPNMGAGYAKHYTTLKDFNSTRKVMGPDNINLKFLNKLNKGK